VHNIIKFPIKVASKTIRFLNHVVLEHVCYHSMSTRRHTNLPNGQLAESEVISPTSRVISLHLSDLLTTAYSINF